MNKNFVIDVDGFTLTYRNEIHDMIKRAVASAVHEGAYSETEHDIMYAEIDRLIEVDRSTK